MKVLWIKAGSTVFDRLHCNLFHMTSIYWRYFQHVSCTCSSVHGLQLCALGHSHVYVCCGGFQSSSVLSFSTVQDRDIVLWLAIWMLYCSAQTMAKRPKSALGNRRPVSEYATVAARMGGNPRFKVSCCALRSIRIIKTVYHCAVLQKFSFLHKQSDMYGSLLCCQLVLLSVTDYTVYCLV